MIKKLKFIIDFFGITTDLVKFSILLLYRKWLYINNYESKNSNVYSINVKRLNRKINLRLDDITTFFEVFYQQTYCTKVNLSPLTIVDLGAHIGFTTIYFQQFWPNASYYCIEPSPSNFCLLTKNVNANCINFAISSSTGNIEFMEKGHSTNFKIAKGADSIKVKSITLSDFLVKQDLATVDLLKCDIEGAEKYLTLDIHKWKQKVNHIIIEIHGDKGLIIDVFKKNAISFEEV